MTEQNNVSWIHQVSGEEERDSEITPRDVQTMREEEYGAREGEGERERER